MVRDNIYRAQNYSRSLSMEANGIARVEIVAIMDNRTSEICKALNGKSLELKTINTYIQTFLADDPERAGFWNDRKNPTDAAVKALGFDKMTGDEILKHLGHKAPPFHIRCRTTLVASVSITARTVSEAQNIAKLQFGVDAKYGGKENLALANHINQGFRTAKELGMSVPNKARISQKFFEKKYPNDWQGKYAETLVTDSDNQPLKRNALYVRPDAYTDLEINSPLLYHLRAISTSRKDHTLLHEISHLNHYTKNKENFLNYQKFSIEKFKDTIFRNLGKRATENPYEFVAEYSVAKIDKIDIPENDKKVLDALYQKLGGFR